MKTLGIVPIVEGHGEVQAARTLLTRTVSELLGGPYPTVLKPIRQPRSKLVGKPKELERAVALGVLNLENSTEPFDHGVVLIMLDADDDLPCELAPKLLARVRRDDADVICVLPNPEYEAWFVAAASSLGAFLELEHARDFVIPDVERDRHKKGWIERRFRKGRYSPPIDQPRLTAAMDLSACRSLSPSYDKLCRDLEARLEA